METLAESIHIESCGVNRNLWEAVLKAIKLGIIIPNGNKFQIGNESFPFPSEDEISDNPYTLAFMVASAIEGFNDHDFVKCSESLRPIFSCI